MPLPNQEMSIYIDYYASIHAKNSASWDNYRIPSSLSNLSESNHRWIVIQSTNVMLRSYGTKVSG